MDFIRTLLTPVLINSTVFDFHLTLIRISANHVHLHFDEIATTIREYNTIMRINKTVTLKIGNLDFGKCVITQLDPNDITFETDIEKIDD